MTEVIDLTPRVYAVRWEKYIKVGYTTNFAKRLRSLTHGLPTDALEVILSVPGNRWLEETVHVKLAAYRTRGEWYRDCLEVRAVINRLEAGKIMEEAF